MMRASSICALTVSAVAAAEAATKIRKPRKTAPSRERSDRNMSRSQADFSIGWVRSRLYDAGHTVQCGPFIGDCGPSDRDIRKSHEINPTGQLAPSGGHEWA